jgi:hypothetical protein
VSLVDNEVCLFASLFDFIFFPYSFVSASSLALYDRSYVLHML